eukprot:TRINITY_DN6527_c0_g1_i2.p1 TRINITY_DN6527_c0_g1~~TRINITY_DN6527_c0_g1_i2.p1  ORF type:complete len:482 (-),score=95.45 TRINITY_DN6527_c0_g1_i2:172-1563(-)
MQPLPNIRKSDIIFTDAEKPPHAGHYGIVRFGMCAGTPVAVKQIKNTPPPPGASEEEVFRQRLEKRRAFEREAEINASQPHPNIAQIIGLCNEDPNEIYLISEKLDGNLEDLLLNHQIPLSFIDRIDMAIQCVKGMLWLQSRNPSFIHRDLKNLNLLYKTVGKKRLIKICDFGLADFLPDGEETLQDNGMTMGTVTYMAPEVMTGTPFNSSIDVFSFGLMFWEILCRRRWFNDKMEKRKFMESVAYHHSRPDLTAPLFSDNGEMKPIPEELQILMQMCWSARPDERPSFKYILQILENYLAKEIIVNDTATLFWLEHFRGDDPTFITFYEKLSIAFNNTSCTVDDIAKALKEGPIEKVSMSDFSKVVKAFGDPSEEFFRLIKQVVDCPGFVSMGREADSRIASSRTDGAYLIRIHSVNIFLISPFLRRYGSDPNTVSLVANKSGPKAIRIKISGYSFSFLFFL